MDKRFVAILAGLVIVFGAIFIFSQKSDEATTTTKGQPTSHIIGKSKSNLTLIEYIDYQCASCEAFYQPLNQIIERYRDRVYFQYRNLPLIQIHPNAFSAARAAEAAGLQGKYFEMHDQLYEPANWQVWTKAQDPVPSYEAYAQTIGLDTQRFKADFASEQVNDAINADIAEFKKSGRPMATPTFFLAGQPLENNQLVDADTGQPSAAKLAAIIDAALAEAKKQVN